MATFGYLVLVLTGSAFGGLAGVAAHWWRANANATGWKPLFCG
jgi:hypothetical protein